MQRKIPSGQSLTETVFLMPWFLMVAFAIIQAGHLGIGVALVNYGASTIARLSVQENGYNAGHAQQRFDQLLAAGFKAAGIEHIQDSDITSNVTVTACAELPAYPFVGQLLQSAFKGQAADRSCQVGGSWISLVGPAPYHFILRGQATARMNYMPHPGS